MAIDEEDKDADQLHPRMAEEILIWAHVTSGAKDNVSKLLRLHALTEYYLERILRLHVRNADAILDDGRFTYHHKRVVVEAVGGLPADVLESLKRLTVLRNKCAHDLVPEITQADIRHAAQPIWQAYEEARSDYVKDEVSSDEMALLSWAMFSQITLHLSPYEIVNAKLASFGERLKNSAE